MQYRALRNEPRVGVANFTIDLVKNQLYEDWDSVEGQRCPPGKIPTHIAKYLCSHHLLIDAQISTDPAASPDPSPSPVRPKQAVLVEGQKNA